MGKLRSAIYSHYSEDPERGLFSCLYCGTHVSISSGTSNMHKHLRVHHPEIDRYVDNGTIVFDQNEFGVVEDDGSHVTLEMPVEELPSTSIVVTSPQAKRKRISGVSTTSTVVVLPSTSTSHVVENEHELNDIPGQKILKRLKQITTDHAELTNQMYVNNAELQNEVMQLQFENQEQMRMIKELRREVNDLKRRMTAHESSESSDYLPKLPIYRMEQVDTLEQRIAGDPEFKERLAAIFREGHNDKVEAIMKWISKEILSQFTYKNDPDSLTTHRCADLSEMFQLMFSVWSSDTFTQEDFKAVVKNAIESANCELSAENCESNKNRQEVEVEEYESEVDDKRGVV